MSLRYDITEASASLQGLVNPDDKPTTYWFELGTTTAYGTTTAPTSMAKGKVPVRVTGAVSGLQPATAYHARVVAKIDKTVLIGLGKGDMDENQTVYRSARNIRGVEVLPAQQFNAYQVLKPKKLLLTKAALSELCKNAKWK